MKIRPVVEDDRTAIWEILAPVIRTGETYALPRDMPEREALDYWLSPVHTVFVADLDGKIAGTYFLRANQKGGGDHVANASYATRAAFRGQGIARAMAHHSLAEARRQGFTAMQFNCVVSTNADAVHLWQSVGFAIVGRLPGAFRHPRLGPVDAFVMFRKLCGAGRGHAAPPASP